MIETWFTSDTHFGHKNILEYEKEHRPFSTIEEMNEALIERWNSVVKSKDNVYHLGDFCMGGKENVAIAGRLNGLKRLIMGNHDTYPMEEYLKYFHKIYGVKFWENCILTHVPVHPQNMRNTLGENIRCVLNVHGHMHSKQMGRACYFNVSVEKHNLTPVNADVILQEVKRQESFLRYISDPNNKIAALYAEEDER